TTNLAATTCNPANVGMSSQTFTTANGCDSIVITTTTWMPLSLELGPTQKVSLSASIQLKAVFNFTPILLSWLGPAGTLSCTDCAEPVVTPTQTAWYELTALDSSGCEAVDSVWLIVEKKAVLYAPNAFMPESGGNNAVFGLFSDESITAVSQLRVYDRWGGAVFDKSNFPLNSPGEGWDGSERGKPAPAGVYVWWARLINTDGTTSEEMGEITLIR
ncbi:MAG: gliding motility-associated C-terminal domain-containing protein, partial [Saprospiraceae bacterium]